MPALASSTKQRKTSKAHCMKRWNASVNICEVSSQESWQVRKHEEADTKWRHVEVQDIGKTSKSLIQHTIPHADVWRNAHTWRQCSEKPAFHSLRDALSRYGTMLKRLVSAMATKECVHCDAVRRYTYIQDHAGHQAYYSTHTITSN